MKGLNIFGSFEIRAEVILKKNLLNFFCNFFSTKKTTIAKCHLFLWNILYKQQYIKTNKSASRHAKQQQHGIKIMHPTCQRLCLDIHIHCKTQ